VRVLWSPCILTAAWEHQDVRDVVTQHRSVTSDPVFAVPRGLWHIFLSWRCSDGACSHITVITGVPASPMNVAAVNSHSQTQVSWDAAFDGGAPVLFFNVTVESMSSPLVKLSKVVYPPATGAMFAGLTPNASYTTTVVAVNAVGASMPAAFGPFRMKGRFVCDVTQVDCYRCPPLLICVCSTRIVHTGD